MNVFSDLERRLMHRPGDPPPKTGAPVHRRSTGKREGSPLPSIPNPWELSPAQAAVLQHMVEGLGNKQIAVALEISIKTVEVHRSRALEKMAASNSVRAAILWDRYIRDAKLARMHKFLPEQNA